MFDNGDAALPARKIYKRGDQKKVNQIAGAKMAGVQQTESMNESNVVMAGAIDPRVAIVKAQPSTFDLNTGRQFSTRKDAQETGKSGGYKPRIYTPDVLFKLVSGAEVFIEAKHTKWLERRPEYFDDLQSFGEMGHRILLVTEQTFTTALVRNIRMLKPYVDRVPTEQQVRSLRSAVHRPIKVADMMSTAGLTQADLMVGIAHGLVRFDMRAGVLGPRTVVEPAHEKSCLEILDL